MDDTQANAAGGTPARQGPGADPLSSGLQALAAGGEKNNALLAAMLKQLEFMQRSLVGNNKEMATFGVELRDTMRDAAVLETSFRRIGQLQKTMLSAGSSRSNALTTIKSMIKEYDSLLTTMNRTKGGGRYIQDVTKSLDDMRKALKLVENQNDATWDARQISDVNKQLRETGKAVQTLADNMKNLKAKNLRDEFRELGNTIDDAFGGRLNAAMRRIPILGGAMKGLDLARQARQAHTNVNTFRTNRASNEVTPQQKAILVARAHGNAGLRMMQRMGHDVPGGAPKAAAASSSTFHATRRGGFAPATQIRDAAGRTTAAGSKAAQSIDKMEIGTIVAGTLVVGKRGKARTEFTSKGRPKIKLPGDDGAPATGLPSNLRSRLLRNASANYQHGHPTADGITQILGGKGGNRLSRLLTDRGLANRASGGAQGGLLGKIGKFFLKDGASSAGQGAGAMLVGRGASIASGAMGVVGKLSGPLAVAGALIQAHDMVAANNKKVSDTLSGTGMFGGGKYAPDAINNVRKTLMSTSLHQTAVLGQGMDQNMDIYKTLMEQGVGTGKTLRGGGLNLSNALSGGQGFHGAIMQNAVHYGDMAGMSQQESVKQTLKLIDKFGAVTDATKQFFVDLNDLSSMSGVSASRIVDMVDAISDQFTDLQRSLIGTVGALQNVGRTGLLTGKKLQETVQGMTKPVEMDTAQRMHNASEIIKTGGGEAIARSLEAVNAYELQKLNKALGKYGISDAVGQSHGDVLDRIQNGGTGVDDETRRADLNAFYDFRRRHAQNAAQADSWRGGRVDEIAARDELAGVTPAQAHAQRMQMLRSVLDAAKVSDADMSDILGGDADKLARISGDLGISQLVKGVFGGNEGLLNSMQHATQVRDAGTSLVMELAGRVPEGKGAASLREDTKDPVKNAANEASHAILAKFGEVARAVTAPNEGESDADALIRYVRTHKGGLAGPLRDVLGRSQALQDMTINGVGPGAAAFKDKSDEAAQAELKAANEDKRVATTTTADIFAKSFEYLFTRMVDALTVLTNIFGGGPDKAEKERKRMQLEAAPFKAHAEAIARAAESNPKLDPSVVRDIRAKANYVGTGSKSEMERKQEELDDLAKRRGIDVSAAVAGSKVLQTSMKVTGELAKSSWNPMAAGAKSAAPSMGRDVGRDLAGIKNPGDRVQVLRELITAARDQGHDISLATDSAHGTQTITAKDSMGEYIGGLLKTAGVGTFTQQKGTGGNVSYVINDVSVAKNRAVSEAGKPPAKTAEIKN